MPLATPPGIRRLGRDMTDIATISAQYIIEVRVSVQKSAGPETSPKECDNMADSHHPAVGHIGDARASIAKNYVRLLRRSKVS